MLLELIKELNGVLTKHTNISVVSQDIDKNTIMPCLKTEVVSYDIDRINTNLFNYNLVLNVNYYPKQNTDKRIEMLNMLEKLNKILAFDMNSWSMIRKESNIEENFISVLVEYNIRILYENEKDITMEDINYENIENIEITRR